MTSKTILNNYCDSGHSCLFSYLSVFHHWKESLLWVCHIWPLLCWDRFLYAHFLESFYHKSVLNFVKTFFCIYWDDHFYSSICRCGVPHWLTWGYWKILRINPIWLWCMVLLIYCSIWIASILLRIFTAMLINDIGF